MFAQPLRKARHFIRHFTCGAIEPNRQPDQKSLHFEFTRNFPQPLQIVGAILSHKHRQRSRRDAQLIGKRQPYAFAAVIERKNPSTGKGSHRFNYTARVFAILFDGLRLCQRFHGKLTTRRGVLAKRLARATELASPVQGHGRFDGVFEWFAGFSRIEPRLLQLKIPACRTVGIVD